MKKLGKFLMLAMTLVLMASCGQGAGKSGEQSTPDPDKLMDELLVAGRAGDWQKVLELDEKINEQKMTTKQAFRFFSEIHQNILLWAMKAANKEIGGMKTALCTRSRMSLWSNHSRPISNLKKPTVNLNIYTIASSAALW